MTENPYASPPRLQSDGRDSLPKSKVAKLAWILPLLALVLPLLLTSRFLWQVEELLMILFFVSLAAGLVFTIYDFLHANRFSNTYRNAIGGCVVYAVFGALIIAGALMSGPTHDPTTLPVRNGTTQP